VRSSKRTGLRAQGGQSLVEALVASAILGVGVMTAVTALDTFLAGASEATKQAAATCAARGEASALEAAQWETNDNIQAYPVAFDNVRVSLQSATGNLQVLVVTATDPSTGRTMATVTVLKESALSGATPPSTPDPPGGRAWCSYLLRASP
jgi:Tfp pilus assembly protein PilV